MTIHSTYTPARTISVRHGAAIVGLLLLAGTPMALLLPSDSADEWWFLQVVVRVLDGESLYRNVFLGVTPLSVWLAAGWMWVFDTSLWALRVFNAVIFAGTGWGLWTLAGRLEISSIPRVGLMAAFLVMAPPISLGVGSPYTPLALMFFLLSVERWVAWMQSPRRWSRAVGACLFIGLCASSKQNMGLLALLPALAVIWWARRAELCPPEASRYAICAGFLLTVSPLLLSLLPVLLAGHLQDMLDFTVRNKVGYVQHGHVSYWNGLNAALAGPWRHTIWAVVLYGLPLAAALAWWGWMRRCRQVNRPLAGVLVLAWIGTILAAFPRVDTAHLPVAVPFSLLGVALWTCGPGPRGRFMRWGYALIFIAVPAMAWVAHLVWLMNNDYGLGRSAEWRWVLVHYPTEWNLQQQSKVLRDRAQGQPTMLLMPDAARYYRLTGIQNPTRFDFPLASVFGRHGQQEVLTAIEWGRIVQVCVQMPPGTLTRFPLIEQIPLMLPFSRDIGPCVMHCRTDCDNGSHSASR